MTLHSIQLDLQSYLLATQAKVSQKRAFVSQVSNTNRSFAMLASWILATENTTKQFAQLALILRA